MREEENIYKAANLIDELFNQLFIAAGVMKKKWKDKTEFKDCVYQYADNIEIKVKSLTLRPMTNKWASCSTAGNLNFNKELLDIDRELGEYVIVHELLHFNVPNHGKLWKSLITAYLGDYEKLEERLKKSVLKE